MATVLIWVQLHGLVLVFWSKDKFKEIGNTLHLFYKFDLPFQRSRHISMAWILVGLNLTSGLPESILINLGKLFHHLILDYEGIYFKYI